MRTSLLLIFILVLHLLLCGAYGNNRKIGPPTSMATSTVKPIQENSENHQATKTTTNRSSTSMTVANDEDEMVSKNYEKAIAMTEMDYSPARRKPPIHN